MDTDELTEMAYRTISLAYDVSENLRAEIGASASLFSTEDEFLRGILEMLTAVLEDPEGYLDSWNSLDETNVTKFADGVQRLRRHVEQTLATPNNQRGERPFE